MTPIDLPGVISPADLDRELLPGERFRVGGRGADDYNQVQSIFDDGTFVLAYKVDGAMHHAAAEISSVNYAGLSEHYFYEVRVLPMPEHLITELPEEVEE